MIWLDTPPTQVRKCSFFLGETPPLTCPTHAVPALPANAEPNLPRPPDSITSTAQPSRSLASPPKSSIAPPDQPRLLSLCQPAKRTCYLVLSPCSAKRPDTDPRQYILIRCICPAVQTQPPLRAAPPTRRLQLDAPPNAPDLSCFGHLALVRAYFPCSTHSCT